MLPSTAMYAVKKRKKPVQKIPKPPPSNATKSNPSKRHRDRLNGELDKLTSLLPFTEEVRARLDKLSVLRLSVGYLKVKSFFNATMKKSQNSSSWTSEGSLMFRGNQNSLPTPSSSTSVTTSSSTPFKSQVASIDGVSFSEGDLLLQALNGFVLVVSAEGYIFYTSPTIQDYLGFHQSDVVHQSVFELIHTDDRPLFRQQLHFAFKPNSGKADGAEDSHSDQRSADISSGLMVFDPQAVPPENSSFLERNFCCRFRCLLDNSSGFLALNFHGRLKFLHGQSQMAEDGTLAPPQLALFSIAMPLQPPSIVEIRTKALIFQTKHKLDFTPMSIDTRGKVVLGYNETELCSRGSGYNFIHAADMMYCADNHVRMIKTGDSGFTVFRLLTKSKTWIWVQAVARLVFKAGKPDFIIARQKALTNEEGEEQLRLRRLQLPFNFATGEALLYDEIPPVEVPDQCSSPKQRKLDTNSFHQESVLGCMLRQDQSIYCEHNKTISSLSDVAFQDTHATVSVPGDIWQHSVPKPPENVLKPDTTVQDMMETLQQILGDSNIMEDLEVEAEELKGWECTLLRMSNNVPDVSEDLNDILSYVEEQLQKEGGFEVVDQMGEVPTTLSTLDLQCPNANPAVEQNFTWSLENQLLQSGGQPVPETTKLTHIDLTQLGSSVLSSPGLHPATSQLPAPGALSNINAGALFNPSSVNATAAPSNTLKTFQVSTKENNYGSCEQSSRHHSKQLPLQGQTRPPYLQNSLLDRGAERKLNPSFDCQSAPWGSSVANTDQVNNFVQTYSHHISNVPAFMGNCPPVSSLHGHVSHQTQSSEHHPQSWSLEQQLQQHVSSGCSNQTPALKKNSPPANGRPMTLESTSGTFPVPQDLEPPHVVPPSSCRFSNHTAPVSVKGLHLTQTSPGKQINPPTHNKIPSKPPCFYQGLSAGGSVLGVPTLPNSEAVISCHMTTGLELNDLLAQQQLFDNFSDHTQVNNHSVMGPNGHAFHPPNHNSFYSENKQ